MKKKQCKVIMCDIDGVICSNEGGFYRQAKPIQKNIDKINALYHAGHTVILWTARGTTTGVDHTKLTEEQMEKWGVSYTALRLEKPFYDFIIDDKALTEPPTLEDN